MAVSFKTYIYPEVGKSNGKLLSKVADVPGEMNKCLKDYLEGEKLHDIQGIVLSGLSKASDMVKAAKKDAGKNELTVRGGMDSKGDLILAVSGILPGSSGSKPYDKSVIVRAGFAKVVEDMKNEANAVVNLHKGDKVIDDAADQYSKNLKAPVQTPDTADFGDIKTGTVLLTAHGTPEKAGGILIGKALGRRSPKEIVDILTENTDRKKNLSKAFSGTVNLAGCFTASGTGEAPPKYDYSTFAGQVLKLLRDKGYTKCNVKGLPGPAITKTVGDKVVESVRHDTTYNAGGSDRVEDLTGTFGTKKR